MFIKKVIITLLIVIFFLTLAQAESIEGLPLHIQKAAPEVVRMWVGDHISSTAVTAVATSTGIVVIDTTELPKLDAAFRKVFARELGRDDFRYLINTHGHADHTNGNGVYSDCEIIAHERVPEMMKSHLSEMPRLIGWQKDSIHRLEAQIGSGKMDERQKAAALEQLARGRMVLAHMTSNPEPVFPTRTFSEQFTLDCGDTAFELYQSGGTHTPSDIFIYIPQKGILFTGDMMADQWLTDTPGCLATFAVRTGNKDDYPVLLRNWKHLLGLKDGIRHYIPGHWNGELSYKGFRDRFDYTRDMLDKVNGLCTADGNLTEFKRVHSLAAAYPHLVNTPGFTNQGHDMTINHLYRLFSGKIHLAEAVRELQQDPSGFSAGLKKLGEDAIKNPGKYFYSEPEINGIGYFLLNQMKQAEAAVCVFRLNRDLFPGSWNVYDSLAEALYEKGEKKEALVNYKKSLELNAGNENARKIIEQIEKEL